MAPGDTTNNRRNCSRCDTKALGQLLLLNSSRLVQLADILNVLCGQSSSRYAFANHRLSAFPGVHISGVAPSISAVKMRGIHTSRIVAMVANQAVVGVGSCCQQIRNAMRLEHLTGNLKKAVPLDVLRSLPLPAILSGGNSDLRPEASNVKSVDWWERFGLSHCSFLHAMPLRGLYPMALKGGQ